MQHLDRNAMQQTRRNARQMLLDARADSGWWVGELSASALSTATAVTALTLMDRARGELAHQRLIEQGVQWLIDHQNDDGGWGDTVLSFSNISTTMLCWGALGLCGGAGESAEAVARAEAWLGRHAGSTTVSALVDAVMRRYGADRTFSVPILTMCALCGRLGPSDSPDTWRWVKQLPFELAAFPQRWYNRLNLRVVSYALPALIAIGRVRHEHRPTRNPLTWLARQATKQSTMRVLDRIQPGNGGFLEATPLTSFVTMSLAGCGLHHHPVARRGAAFLADSAREDSGWPIDTNLATWVTTLSINALASGGRLHEHLDEEARRTVRDWLLDQQYTHVHPYTGAAPGGWAWTDLPGGVPDADDTAGAVLALHHLDVIDDRTRLAATKGLNWLQSLQNHDGGIPTFCRGWGKLPFDRSSVDITAHYLRAAAAWPQAEANVLRAWRYLVAAQRPGGEWHPLWFGNQHQPDESNPVYCTSRVLRHVIDTTSAPARRAIRWMLSVQNADGGWGGDRGAPSSIEETALAVEALADEPARADPAVRHAVTNGVQWLIDRTERGTRFEPSPIGFYFAKLWYYEKLYPLIFTVGAMERAGDLCA